MFDRVTNINEEGGVFRKGEIVVKSQSITWLIYEHI
jgi:hypothetical protein